MVGIKESFPEEAMLELGRVVGKAITNKFIKRNGKHPMRKAKGGRWPVEEKRINSNWGILVDSRAR